MKRIAHIVYRPRYSGAELLVARLASTHLRSGVESRVIALCPPEASFEAMIHAQRQEGVTWVSPPGGVKRGARLQFLRSAIADFQPEVVFAHSLIPAFYARLANAGVITVLHDASEDDYASPAYRLTEHLLARRTRHVIAVTAAAKRNYLRRFPGRDVTVIPNGVDTERFARCSEDDGAEWRGRHDIGEGAQVLVQIGRYTSVKQQLKSLLALTPLLRAHSNLVLVFAGAKEDPFYFEALRAAAFDAQLGASVRLLDATLEVDKMLAGSDVYLMPSAHEAHSVAMLEALSSGLPVVASDIDSFKFVDDHEGTWRVEVDDSGAYRHAVEEALRSRPRRYKRSLDQFGIQRTADEYLKIAQ